MVILNLYNLLFVVFLPLFAHASANWEELTEQIYQMPEAFNLKTIGEGGTNSNYLLTLDECQYFVRIAPPGAESLGASIEIEYEVLDKLKKFHISPKPIYLNQKRKILVTEFMPFAKEADLLDPDSRLKVLSLLHTIEASNITLSRTYLPYLHVMELIDLAKSLHDPVCPLFNNEILPALKIIDAMLPQEKTLCHFDLHHGNILINHEHVWIIDWEYATMADRFLTLASMASTERWNDDQMKTILNEYLPNHTESDYHTLFLNRIVIDTHWAAWCHVQKNLSPLNMPYEEWENHYFSEALSRIRSSQYLDFK